MKHAPENGIKKNNRVSLQRMLAVSAAASLFALSAELQCALSDLKIREKPLQLSSEYQIIYVIDKMYCWMKIRDGEELGTKKIEET